MIRRSLFGALVFFCALVNVLAADSPTIHTVAWGETLYSIARAYGVTPQAIASANGINVNSWVYAGTRLTIPTSQRDDNVAPTTPSGYYSARAGDTLFSIAARFGTTTDAISSANNLPSNGILYVGWSLKIPTRATPITQSPNRRTHIVQPGEFLARIALRYDITAQAIAYANDLPNDWMIYPGQRLNIPGAPAPSTVAQGASASATTNIRLTNVPLYQQKQTLTCEEASAAMATRGAISEARLVAAMPRSDNPFNGIRGRTNAPYYGGLTDYGVYAQGLQKGLSALGIKSQVLYGQSYDEFKDDVLAHLRAGRAIVWWHTWQDS
ncbi:MAG: LysM peptidoglycan-binding domain-containing protein, partial [Anaerolineales bacterium]|nr:LysM peptidoglycan-binding domain-containing protein [Anaerolineales bacterium]